VNKELVRPRQDRHASAAEAARGGEAQRYSPSLLTLSAPLSAGAEQIRALRTHMVAQHIEAGRRALAVCAASYDVGCTFVAANLAVATAQIGLKTLLIDADLREPMIQKVLPPRMEGPGLSHCLAGPGGSVGDFIDDDVLPNLSVLHAGTPAFNAQELLAREWFQDVMTYCLREYDFTVVDTPPANTSADARRISNVVGYSLIVARRDQSVVADVRTLAEQLLDDNVNVVGTLLTNG
jgi:capsular exopolysaccharide synthesis family protein